MVYVLYLTGLQLREERVKQLPLLELITPCSISVQQQKN